MSHRILSLALFVAMAALAWKPARAQDPDYFKKPTTPAEYWRAIQFEINVGKYDLAAAYLKGMLESNPTDKDLLDLEAKYGLVSFLRLRNIPQWSENKAIDAQARKNAEGLIERVSGALKAELSNPKRIARFAQKLIATPEEAEYAEKEIRRSGAFAIPVLIDILRSEPALELRVAIYDLLPRLDLSTVPPLLAALDVPDPTLRLGLLDALRQRRDFLSLAARVETDPTPTLWYLAAQRPNTPALLRDKALSLLGVLLGIVPERYQPSAELTRIAERFYEHKAAFASPVQVTVWLWRKDALVPVTYDVSQAEEYYGLRFARWALELNPKNEPAQNLFLSLAVEKAYQRAGLDRPLAKADPAVYSLLATAPYELLADVLDRALREQRSAVALAVVQALGDRASISATRPTVRNGADNRPVVVKPALLVRALEYPDPRVQLAAADALLRSPGPPAYDAGPKIVDVLKRALQAEPPGGGKGKPKAMIGDPDQIRGQEVAKLVRRAGFDVEITRSGRDLMRRLNDVPDFDLLVIDRHLAYPPLPEIIAQLRADVRVGLKPLLLVASSDAPIPPNPYVLIGRLALLIAALDEPPAPPKAPKEPAPKGPPPKENVASRELLGRTARVSDILNARLRRLQELVAEAGVPESEAMTQRMEWMTLLIGSTEGPLPGPMRDRLAYLNRVVKPVDRVLPEVQERTVRLTDITGRMETEFPADRVPRLEKLRDDAPAVVPPEDVRDYILETRLNRLIRPYRQIRVIPEPLTENMLQRELVGVLAQAKVQPLSDAEKKGDAVRAMIWLRRLALGEVKGFDVRPAGDVIRRALLSDELAPLAVDAVGRLPTKDAQQDLANLVLATTRPMSLRLRAADVLIQHVQAHGNSLSDVQVRRLAELSGTEPNADLRERLLALMGILLPSTDETSLRLRAYVPPPPGTGPMPKEKEEPKDKEEPKKEE